MQAPPTPRNERARLETLRALNVLDTEPDAELDELTELASEVCATPVALLTLVDENRQWFKSNRGFALSETSRDISFCAHAILDESVLEISDAWLDPRFRDNELVTCEPFVRFYAGAPLQTSEGHNVGTLCVIDSVPRKLSGAQRNCLQLLARSAIRNLELRNTGKSLGRALLGEQNVADRKAWLSAYIAHESRNMLTVLGSMLHVLSLSKLSPAQTSALSAAQCSAETLGRLMQDVLDLTRSDSQTLSLVEQPFDLRIQLERLAVPYQASLSPRGVSLRLELDPTLPCTVVGDARRLDQILHNLLGNAAKFTQEGEIVLSAVALEGCGDNERHSIRFEVRDQGPGMDAATLAKLFGAYRPGVDQQSGTGLGLYIARELVEQLGGTIGARSCEREGSTFHFVLQFPSAAASHGQKAQ